MNRRDVLLALAAIAAPLPAAAGLPDVDAAGAKTLGEAYLRVHPGVDAARLQADLLPHGWNAAALRARVAADFRAGRLFVHRGWRLSDTEGRLFALAALTPA